ncbi:hypothetical protein KM1_054160 [Entamoeba histolytica HM-3:IMSS]|uniref:Uncharacterized protein n=1 Tax=Entamoeba histolytica HM-3:IMSS TaxID=885315 RepID=M7W887_ENTHI|nr:hypothetical protein KM1_054160 [Entamoeba histolytica HM-3:IMSS]
MNNIVVLLFFIISILIIILICYISYNLIQIHILEERIKQKESEDEDYSDGEDPNYIEQYHMLGGEDE